MTPLIRRLSFFIILVAYCLAGTLFAVVTPAWQSPDEPAHFNYVRYLATHADFPTLTAGCYDQPYLNQLTSRQFPPDLSINSVCYEYHQPPLYYLLAELFYFLGGGALLAIRLVSVAMGAGVMAIAFLIGHTIFPNRPAISLGAMAFVAFVPMHVSILASVNNDALAGLIFATILLSLVRRLRQSNPPAFWQNALLGLLLGLALVTKTTIYIAAPLVGVALLLSALHYGFGWQRLVLPALIVFGLALLLALPWYWRNTALYGGIDILGLHRHNEVVIGQLRTADFVADVGLPTYTQDFIITTFHSFWGQFGWMAVPMDSRTYRLLAWLSLLALSGLGLFLLDQWKSWAAPPLAPEQWLMLTLLAASALLTGLAYGWYNLSFVQFQGRYLFTAIIPLGLFFAVGLHTLLAARWRWVLVGGLAAATAWLAIASGQQGGLDKWGLLIAGVMLALAIARIFLPQYRAALGAVLLLSWYSGLALLTLLSPYWFVMPYL